MPRQWAWRIKAPSQMHARTHLTHTHTYTLTHIKCARSVTDTPTCTQQMLPLCRSGRKIRHSIHLLLLFLTTKVMLLWYRFPHMNLSVKLLGCNVQDLDRARAGGQRRLRLKCLVLLKLIMSIQVYITHTDSSHVV